MSLSGPAQSGFCCILKASPPRCCRGAFRGRSSVYVRCTRQRACQRRWIGQVSFEVLAVVSAATCRRYHTPSLAAGSARVCAPYSVEHQLIGHLLRGKPTHDSAHHFLPVLRLCRRRRSAVELPHWSQRLCQNEISGCPALLTGASRAWGWESVLIVGRCCEADGGPASVR
jgi:hypothetical protein